MRTTLLAAAAFAAALTALTPSSLKAADSPSADDAWKKVEDAINAIEKPKEQPKSRDEAVKLFTEGLQKFDAAAKDFNNSFPKDARRWRARLFEGETANVRKQLNLPAAPGGDLEAAVDSILKADDADANTKGDASGIKVLSAAEEAGEGGKLSMDDWQKMAEAHLKAYPDFRGNQEISGRITANHALADLKSKPLDLKFQAVDGREVDLSTLRGKVVLVDFWATWCGPCVGEVPHVVEAFEKLHPKGFEIVGISLDQNKDKLTAFVKDKSMTWPQYFDGKGWQNAVSSRFGIQSIPAMWLVNKKGMVVSTNARGKLEEEVEKLLAE